MQYMWKKIQIKRYVVYEDSVLIKEAKFGLLAKSSDLEEDNFSLLMVRRLYGDSSTQINSPSISMPSVYQCDRFLFSFIFTRAVQAPHAPARPACLLASAARHFSSTFSSSESW